MRSSEHESSQKQFVPKMKIRPSVLRDFKLQLQDPEAEKQIFYNELLASYDENLGTEILHLFLVLVLKLKKLKIDQCRVRETI